LIAILQNECLWSSPFQQSQKQQIRIDGNDVAEGVYRTIIIVNGNLGPDLPFSDKPLGNKEFYVYCIQDKGFIKLFQQALHAKDGTIMNDPGQWGFESYTVGKHLTIYGDADATFPVNIDGSTLLARTGVEITRTGTISLLANSGFECQLVHPQ